jgi:hypothetical protein
MRCGVRKHSSRSPGHGLSSRVRGLFSATEWNIGIIRRPISSFLEPGGAPYHVQWLNLRRNGRYLADPFGVWRGDRIHVFCEEYDYTTCRGHILHIELTTRGECVSSEVVLKEPWHMSYPHLITQGEGIYCIPETHQSGEVALYRAESFPHGWSKAAVLLSGVTIVDSTVVEHAGRWWLMGTDESRDSNRRLYVWHAPSLFGPWEAHAMNPVKECLASARPAGSLFTHRGELYRPAQDCAEAYGRRVVINRVLRLTPTEFEETPIAYVEPDPSGPYPSGLHTIVSVGGITLVDGKREGLSLRGPRKRLLERAANRRWERFRDSSSAAHSRNDLPTDERPGSGQPSDAPSMSNRSAISGNAQRCHAASRRQRRVSR